MVTNDHRVDNPTKNIISHCSIKDNWYEDMFTLKGTMCLVNVGVCKHNPAIYIDNATLFDTACHNECILSYSTEER